MTYLGTICKISKKLNSQYLKTIRIQLCIMWRRNKDPQIKIVQSKLNYEVSLYVDKHPVSCLNSLDIYYN